MLDSALGMLYTSARRLLKVCIVLIAQGDEQLKQEALNLKSILTNHEENYNCSTHIEQHLYGRHHR